MTFSKRILRYILFLAVIYLFTILIIYTDIGIESFIGLYILLMLCNIIFGLYALKLKVLPVVLVSAVIPVISIISALLMADHSLFPGNDPYGIITAILTNGIVIILCWEVTYQVNAFIKPVKPK
ncbi:hypothetical protein [Flavobacterium coralii]|uniref:hypothetical protein n=1 Tax=Flavobacterium coralii TaxID=2838017 RepID=UPI000C4000A7|nr:hypothetical protein [Flavobacterium sp.]|tara:strand:- start:92673 stop:93044 length:372 start_codon:yes stop_codon:yes gene_type:complete